MTLRVLMTADTAGGVWIHALSLCRALADHHVRVRLLALGQPDQHQLRAARALGNLDLVVRPVRLEWMADPWRDLDGLEAELLSQAELADCDVVHLNHLVHGHLPWRQPVLCAVHSCVLSWFQAVRGEPAPPQWETYRRRVARSLGSANHVVAPSRWMLRRARELYGPFRARTVIVNGSAAPLEDPRTPRTGILGAGRVWDEAKNLRPLAELASRTSAPVRIAGAATGPDGQRVELGAARVGALDQEALWRTMRGSKLFVAPALYEPFGLGVLEAARSGCALVLGDIPSLRELWSGAAVFVDPHRPEEWPPVLETLLGDDRARLALALAARRRAARYGVERMAQEYLALYRHALAASPVRAAS